MPAAGRRAEFPWMFQSHEVWIITPGRSTKLCWGICRKLAVSVPEAATIIWPICLRLSNFPVIDRAHVQDAGVQSARKDGYDLEGYPGRTRTLFHMTDEDAARLISRSQTFRPGTSGMFVEQNGITSALALATTPESRRICHAEYGVKYIPHHTVIDGKTGNVVLNFDGDVSEALDRLLRP